MGVIGIAAILVGTGDTDIATMALVAASSLVVPTFAGFLLLRAGMSLVDVVSWAVPSWLAWAIALSFPIFPAVLVPYLIGMGLPTLMLFSESARRAWYRYILRAPDRAR
jgi:hypothetical protein